jgi:hypothetical protein
MDFLRWICEKYILLKKLRGKRGRRKSVNQYWRDFKMLYRRANGSFVNANDSYEVVKVRLILAALPLVLKQIINLKKIYKNLKKL